MEVGDLEVPDWTCPRSGRTLSLKSSQLTLGRIDTKTRPHARSHDVTTAHGQLESVEWSHTGSDNLGNDRTQKS